MHHRHQPQKNNRNDARNKQIINNCAIMGPQRKPLYREIIGSHQNGYGDVDIIWKLFARLTPSAL